MVTRLTPVTVERLVEPRIPVTEGLGAERAVELARVAQSCIVLATDNPSAFIAELPVDASEYHAYTDSVELIFRLWQTDDTIKPRARTDPSTAKASTTEIWRRLICRSDPLLAAQLMEHVEYPPFINTWFHTAERSAARSALMRTIISDTALFEYYERLKKSGYCPGNVGYMAMLLASNHPELLDPTWPDDVLEFM